MNPNKTDISDLNFEEIIFSTSKRSFYHADNLKDFWGVINYLLVIIQLLPSLAKSNIRTVKEIFIGGRPKSGNVSRFVYVSDQIDNEVIAKLAAGMIREIEINGKKEAITDCLPKEVDFLEIHNGRVYLHSQEPLSIEGFNQCRYIITDYQDCNGIYTGTDVAYPDTLKDAERKYFNNGLPRLVTRTIREVGTPPCCYESVHVSGRYRNPSHNSSDSFIELIGKSDVHQIDIRITRNGRNTDLWVSGEMALDGFTFVSCEDSQQKHLRRQSRNSSQGRKKYRKKVNN